MPKVFDTFSMFNELDLLEIRLNILDPYVDYFVIAESSETFSGKPKPLYYQDNLERFAKWNDKILWIENPKLETSNSFERAGFQKDNLRKFLIGLADDNDIVYFGDLDEIFKPRYGIQKEIPNDKVYNLKQLNYSYYLNNLSSEEWIGTIVGKWGTIKNNTFNHWRANHDSLLPNGGWHFSNVGGVEQIRKKLEAYDHQEFNTESIKDDLKNKIKNNEDYLGRQLDYYGKPFVFKTDESELPQYLLDNRDKWKHLFK